MSPAELFNSLPSWAQAVVRAIFRATIAQLVRVIRILMRILLLNQPSPYANTATVWARIQQLDDEAWKRNQPAWPLRAAR